MNKQELRQTLGDRRDWDGLNALEEEDEPIFVDTKTPGQRIYEAFSAQMPFAFLPPMDMPWPDLPKHAQEAWEFAAQDLLKAHYYPW